MTVGKGPANGRLANWWAISRPRHFFSAARYFSWASLSFLLGKYRSTSVSTATGFPSSKKGVYFRWFTALREASYK